ncbi:MAG: ATP-binding cassette domain-containing protein [Anaerolineales bacterium]|jgi:ABC-2 type transport system ATP-binding protein
MSDREIIVENLIKHYPNGVRAVDDISLKVEAGQIFGFLGPNGAGKSTAVKILTTLALPSGGIAKVGGFDVVKEAEQVRRIAGVALQEVGLDPIMKSMELLGMQARLFGANKREALERGEELLELVGLDDAKDRRIGTYSGGMRRRLDLALALVHDPEVLFLDEPTTGLDPASRRDVWEEVRRLNRSLGVTIFLTTQYLEEADELADVVAIINQGKIVAEGTPAELKAGIGNESINLAFENTQMAGSAKTHLGNISESMQIDRDVLRLYVEGAAEKTPQVLKQLSAAQIEPISLTITQPSLDDVFLRVTGQRLEEEKRVDPESLLAKN